MIFGLSLTGWSRQLDCFAMSFPTELLTKLLHFARCAAVRKRTVHASSISNLPAGASFPDEARCVPLRSRHEMPRRQDQGSVHDYSGRPIRTISSFHFVESSWAADSKDRISEGDAHCIFNSCVLENSTVLSVLMGFVAWPPTCKRRFQALTSLSVSIGGRAFRSHQGPLARTVCRRFHRPQICRLS